MASEAAAQASLKGLATVPYNRTRGSICAFEAQPMSFFRSIPLRNFDEARFLKAQSGALALATRLDSAMAAALNAGAPNIHFLGTGGAAILMRPAVYLLRRRSVFPVFDDFAAELLVSDSRNLTEGSIVVIPSQSGTTKESVEVMEMARARRAIVIALVGEEASPLARGSDHVMVNNVTDASSSESFYIQSLLIALSLLRHRGEIANYDALLKEMLSLPKQFVRLKVAMEPRAAEYARRLANHDYHLVTASGNAWPEACAYGMCTLEEMQWIRTRPVHASDFFHGTFELVEPGVSVLLLKGEDEMRPLADRVERFVTSVGAALTVIDTAEYATIGLSNELRALVSPALLATLLERISAHLEVLRDHPLTTRRYFRRIQY